mmetsp:Transcript_26296/g.36648  ORF Transcript_26296/g.36648 Transcript_26296/m.36648 type:complete len:243 (-) Transcript_26296:125-853(-)|eukprot:CAMPEP_0184486494 /NCGR_PEP_ID=MMETSP0113_2-20130426/7977_1 /TAXON_ID=91329 /ORGANISM="Norrisiella sphaerica, Strain BC52" /LENGTH=242 /DNA_ID=CAMNT_0026868395 /DNA_START=77 /DNA_END=805 /DNA_ORIENTATION=+
MIKGLGINFDTICGEKGLENILEEEIEEDLHDIMDNGQILPLSAKEEISDANDVLETKEEKIPTPRILLVTAMMNLQMKLNLKAIAMKARNAEYNPKRFAAVIMRIREPKSTALIFESGKVVMSSRNPVLAKQAAKKFVRIIQVIGFEAAKFSEFKIVNIMGQATVPYKIRLDALSEAHDDYCNFEPDLFAGLIYRMVEPKIVLTVFASGKVNMTGAKSEEQISKAFENIYPVLKNFKRKGI